MLLGLLPERLSILCTIQLSVAEELLTQVCNPLFKDSSLEVYDEDYISYKVLRSLLHALSQVLLHSLVTRSLTISDPDCRVLSLMGSILLALAHALVALAIVKQRITNQGYKSLSNVGGPSDFVVKYRQGIFVVLLIADSIHGRSLKWAVARPVALVPYICYIHTVLTREIDVFFLALAAFLPMYAGWIKLVFGAECLTSDKLSHLVVAGGTTVYLKNKIEEGKSAVVNEIKYRSMHKNLKHILNNLPQGVLIYQIQSGGQASPSSENSEG
jgi:hypothetical protein